MKLKGENTQNGGKDADARDRAVRDTNLSFVMEASAGTGKTHTLISRMLHLVLESGPEGIPLQLSEICAITFTEKAAGEMKVRLRQHFEQTLHNPHAFLDHWTRARKALDDLEVASISTFHSFAVGILKERPIEAGLDPRFSALDEIQSELYFKEVWGSWIVRALEKRDPILEKALRNGFRLQNLEDLARILRLKWLTIRNLDCEKPPSDEECLARIQSYLHRGKELLNLAVKSEDKLVTYLDNALNWLEHPNEDPNALRKPGNAGVARNWSGGKDTVDEVKIFLQEAVDFFTFYKKIPAQRLLDEVVRWMIQTFIREEWEKKKQADGYLDFDDQLYLACELLRNHETIRRDFQARYKVLLVDEFQDTDLIQLEIVLLLTSKDFRKEEGTSLRPEPGRLFIVGDPKQSIYRFRNADIETYLGIVSSARLKSLGIERLCLTTNFRSVPSILNFVDTVFEGTMKAPEDGGRYQPEYMAFAGQGARCRELSPPSVHLLGDIRGEESSKRKVGDFTADESVRIAKLIREICGSDSWKIQAAGNAEANEWRAPQYGDIAILLPVLSHVDILEDALRDLEIPYVLEGGKFYYSRSEVSSAITVLRSIANPNDAVALYGALRSIFFGISDEDLLQAHINRLDLDYRESVPEDSVLYHPFEILRDLHRYRHERRASETLEVLLQKTGAREVLAVRGYQSLANLNKLARTLRALQGDSSFPQMVDALDVMDEEGLAESESRIMEERSNAVRVMSIHKSKGLDFPVVIVAGLGSSKRSQSKHLLADSHERKVFAVKVGTKETGLQTAGWDALVEREKKLEEAELMRLLYVAFTRARDYLIVSTHTSGWKKLEQAEIYIPETDGTRLQPLGIFLEECYSGEGTVVRVMDTAQLDSAVIPAKTFHEPIPKDWQSIARAEYAKLHELLCNTPSTRSLPTATHALAVIGSEDAAREDRLPEAVENRAARLGTAFHEAMERVDWFCQGGVIPPLQEFNMRYGLDRESAQKLREMVDLSLASELIERARIAMRAGGRILREVPFVRPLNGSAIEEGKIDLLFEEAAGWVLVDYKTDWVSKDQASAESFFRERYFAQIQEYRSALETLSIKVVDAYLLLARTGDMVRML